MNPAAPYADAGVAAGEAVRSAEVTMEGPGVPISFAKAGESGTIVSVSGSDKTRQFLNELGFTPGTVVKVVSQSGGNLILDVKGAKIAIEKSSASKIKFRPSS